MAQWFQQNNHTIASPVRDVFVRDNSRRLWPYWFHAEAKEHSRSTFADVFKGTFLAFAEARAGFEPMTHSCDCFVGTTEPSVD